MANDEPMTRRTRITLAIVDHLPLIALWAFIVIAFGVLASRAHGQVLPHSFWSRQGSLQAPAVAESAAKAASVNSNPFRPVRETHSLATKFHDSIDPRVSRLEFLRDPSRVTRLITKVHIDPVKRHSFWPLPDSADERFKRVSPSEMHLDSPSAVVPIISMLRIFAPLNHVQVGFVHRSLTQPVRDSIGPSRFGAKASAASGLSDHQHVARNDGGISTIAPTFKLMFSAGVSACITNRDESSEPLANVVFESPVRRDRMGFSHDGSTPLGLEAVAGYSPSRLRLIVADGRGNPCC